MYEDHFHLEDFKKPFNAKLYVSYSMSARNRNLENKSALSKKIVEISRKGSNLPSRKSFRFKTAESIFVFVIVFDFLFGNQAIARFCGRSFAMPAANTPFHNPTFTKTSFTNIFIVYKFNLPYN